VSRLSPPHSLAGVEKPAIEYSADFVAGCGQNVRGPYLFELFTCVEFKTGLLDELQSYSVLNS